MSTFVDRILGSGLIDKTTVRLMEQWGYLPEGSVEKVREEALKSATRETLIKMADSLDVLLEEEMLSRIKATNLDLRLLRWPDVVSIYRGDRTKENALSNRVLVAENITAMKDRFGRYYFPASDCKEVWFSPGFFVVRKNGKAEEVMESQMLFLEDSPVCIQVSTRSCE